MDAVDRKRLELIRLKAQYADQLRYCLDPLDPTSRPTEEQLRFLTSQTNVKWVVASNRSGKSATAAREVAWWFSNSHPYLDRPEAWGDGPLQLLVIGRTMEMVENELWANKILKFFHESEVKVVRTGNVIQRAIHRKTGNTIIFKSHHDALHAREKIQGFTSHVVWMDEMPDHAGLVTELMMRTITTNGFFLATFTPLIRNEDIKRLVEEPNPNAEKFKFLVMDNPALADRRDEIESQFRSMSSSEAEFRARMYGEWYYGDTRVFVYSREQHGAKPEGYHTGWTHAAIVDPSASGLTGLLIAARQLHDPTWYIVRATYINGAAAYELVETVEQMLQGVNVQYRYCDCNPAGFYKEAHRRGLKWTPVTDKQDRKAETIDGVNKALTQGRVRLSPGTEALEDELVRAQWSETNPDKVSNASSFHLADCMRYLVDNLDKFVVRSPQYVPQTQGEAIRMAWKEKVRKRERNARLIQRARRQNARPVRWFTLNG